MNDKKHIICHLCNEPDCLEKDCIFQTYPHEIAQGLKRLTQGTKSLTQSKSLTTRQSLTQSTKSLPQGDKKSTQGSNSLIDFRYLPTFFRGGKKTKEVMIKQEKQYVVCYLCDEPKCLKEECLFLTDPRDITKGMKNYISFIDISYDAGKSGKAKETPLNLLYIHGVKLFWFSVVIGTVIYIIVFGGLPFLSIAFSGMQSQMPSQVYFAIFGAAVTAICLVMANLFGTESGAAK